MRTVIFDLDGTLVDTGADLIGAANACFRGLGHGDLLHPVHDCATAFAGGRAMLRLGFGRLTTPWSEADVDAQYQHLLESYASNIDRQSRIYPGADMAVERLRQAGYAVAICTNKPAYLAELLLQRLGFRDAFAALVGADTLPVRKPDPAPLHEAVRLAGGNPQRVLMVGDTITDRDTARAAGVPVALVTFGPEGHGVARLEPDALLEHFDALYDLAERFT